MSRPFAEPLAMLEECHGEIERQLGALEALGRYVATGDAARARPAAKGVLHFFDASGAEHHRDEDEDLFPLLRARAGALGRSEIAAVIDELEREHATMEAQWRRLKPSLALISTAQKAALDDDEIARFAWLYRRHMEREGLLVLPFARDALTPEERSAFGKRMAARRARTN